MKIDQALQKIFESDQTFGYNYNTWRSFKSRFKKGKLLSDRSKRSILKRCGMGIVQDEEWDFVKSK
jgi:hypothetical protein